MHIMKVASALAVRIWRNTFLVFTTGAILVATYLSASGDGVGLYFIPAALRCIIASAIGSLPGLVALYFILPGIKKIISNPLYRIYTLLFIIFLITVPYGLVFSFHFNWPLGDHNTYQEFLQTICVASGCLFASSAISIGILAKDVKSFFNYHQIINKQIMESNEQVQSAMQNDIQEKAERKNNVLIKALLVAALILIMLIPMAFIQSLVMERKDRQAEAIKEVSSKWAGPQTISNPY